MSLIAALTKPFRRTAQPAQTAVAVPDVQQSVDQLISIMQASYDVGLTGSAAKALTDQEAREKLFRWQYGAASVIASAVMMTPLMVETWNGKAWEADEHHALALLLEDANSFMTGEELFYWSVMDLCMVGRSWWEVRPDGTGMPAELWPLLGTITPITDPEAFVTGWKQQVILKGEIKSAIYEADQVVYLRIPKTTDLAGGYGPMQAAGAAIKLDEQIVQSRWSAFKNGLFPYTIVKFDEENPQKRKQKMQELEETYAGARRTGKPIGTGKDVDFVWPQTKPKEMGYESGAKETRDSILGTLRTPAAILGLSEDVNRASAEGMEYIFSKWTIKPLLRMIQARLNQDLARKFYDETRVRFDNPVPADREADRRLRDTNMRHGITVINEARGEDGLEPVPWGDKPFLPAGMAQVGSAPPDKDGKGQTFQEQAARGFTAAERRAIHVAYAGDRLKSERRLGRVFAAYFRALGKDVLAAWDEVRRDYEQSLDDPALVLLAAPDAALNGVLDPEKMAADMARKARPANRQALVLGGDFERSLKADPSAYDWSDGNAAIDRYMGEFGAAHYGDVAMVTRQQMMAVVAKGIKEKATWDEVRFALVQKLGSMTEARAANIAVTETTKLYNTGGQAFREEFNIGHKQWLCSFVNSRDTHLDADGQVVRNDEYFDVGGDRMKHPGGGNRAEENCNCNCLVVGVERK